VNIPVNVNEYFRLTDFWAILYMERFVRVWPTRRRTWLNSLLHAQKAVRCKQIRGTWVKIIQGKTMERQ
jgi:hypothetical protein